MDTCIILKILSHTLVLKRSGNILVAIDRDFQAILARQGIILTLKCHITSGSKLLQNLVALWLDSHFIDVLNMYF